MKKILYLILLLLPQFSFAQDSLRVMFYNLYRFPVNAPANREFLLEQILKEAKPDLLMACEIVNKDGSDRILNTAFHSLPDSFSAPQFVYCPTAEDDPLQQMVYYNTRKLTLLHQEALPAIIRDINHYTFYLNNSYSSGDSALLDVFVTHLKAGEGSANSWLRETMADSFVKALQKIPTNHHVLLAGDFNFYSDQEAAFRIFTDTSNVIKMEDPLLQPGDWHNNPGFGAIHTQATRKTLSGFGLGGASGGINDRFDFILISKNLRTDSMLFYQPDSYHSFGNNGNCFNKAVNNDTCVGAYSLPLRNLLFQMSDHLPVIMNLRTSTHFPAVTKVEGSKTGQQKMLYFPKGNIFSQQLILELKTNRNNQQDVVFIYDLTGRIIETISFLPFEKRTVIRTEEWTPGLYFARYRQETVKLLKQ